jgi:hypothetical protein
VPGSGTGRPWDGASPWRRPLWSNSGTGLPNDLKGSGWTAVSVVSASAGLVLLTVLVGVALRKFVR